MAKDYLMVNESTGRVGLVNEAVAYDEKYRNLTAEERLLLEIKQNTNRIRGLLEILIILGVIAGGCGVLFVFGAVGRAF